MEKDTSRQRRGGRSPSRHVTLKVGVRSRPGALLCRVETLIACEAVLAPPDLELGALQLP